MARSKPSKKKPSQKKNQKRPVTAAGRNSADSDAVSVAEVWEQLSQNRLGVIGFGLSLLQVLAHASWMALVAWLSSSGRAELLKPNDWGMWLISGLVITGAALTMVSLFICLYAALHGKPKILAIIGLSLSFFIGMLTTFILVLQAAAPT